VRIDLKSKKRRPAKGDTHGELGGPIAEENKSHANPELTSWGTGFSGAFWEGSCTSGDGQEKP